MWASDRAKPTSQLVKDFAQKKKESPWVFSLYEKAFPKMRMALEWEDWKAVGRWMDFNHSLLAYFGMSSVDVERARALLKEEGALGAKVTGAGQGGNVIAVFETREDAQTAADNIRKKGYKAMAP